MPTLNGASVQYGDMRGSAALDTHGGMITDITKHLGVPGFPIAIDISHGSEYTGRDDRGMLSITCFTTDVAAGADDVAKYAREHGNKIPAKGYRRKISLEDFAKVVKRFEVVLKSRVIGNAEIEYETVEEELED